MHLSLTPVQVQENLTNESGCQSIIELGPPLLSHLILHCCPCNPSAPTDFYHRLKSLSKQALLFSCHEERWSWMHISCFSFNVENSLIHFFSLLFFLSQTRRHTQPYTFMQNFPFSSLGSRWGGHVLILVESDWSVVLPTPYFAVYN